MLRRQETRLCDETAVHFCRCIGIPSYVVNVEKSSSAIGIRTCVSREWTDLSAKRPTLREHRRLVLLLLQCRNAMCSTAAQVTDLRLLIRVIQPKRFSDQSTKIRLSFKYWIWETEWFCPILENWIERGLRRLKNKVALSYGEKIFESKFKLLIIKRK